MSHDVVAIGEAMIRLSTPAGARLEDAPHFEVHVGGAEANVAVAVARMGYRTAWLTRLPTNALGRRAAESVRRHGVDVDHVVWTGNDRMGLYFVEIGAEPRPTTVIYDRARSAASLMTAADVAWEVVESARIVHLSGITPALSPSCRDLAAEVVDRARRVGALVSFDVNYRARLWSAAEAAEVLGEIARSVDLVIATAEDARDLFGIGGTPREAASALAEHMGVRRVVVTAGSAGSAWLDGDTSGLVEIYPAAEIDRVGAGDAFAAGVLIGLLSDDLERGVRQGTAMAAIKRGITGDHFIAGPDDVAAVMRGGTRQVSR